MTPFHNKGWVELEATLSIAACAPEVLLSVIMVNRANSIVRVCVRLTQEGVCGDMSGFTALIKSKRVFLHSVHFEPHQNLTWIVSDTHIGEFIVSVIFSCTKLPFRRCQLLESYEVIPEALRWLFHFYRIL